MILDLITAFVVVPRWVFWPLAAVIAYLVVRRAGRQSAHSLALLAVSSFLALSIIGGLTDYLVAKEILGYFGATFNISAWSVLAALGLPGLAYALVLLRSVQLRRQTIDQARQASQGSMAEISVIVIVLLLGIAPVTRAFAGDFASFGVAHTRSEYIGNRTGVSLLANADNPADVTGDPHGSCEVAFASATDYGHPYNESEFVDGCEAALDGDRYDF